MRFHHSTRRGRQRLATGGHQARAGPRGAWAKCASLGYCRETNIHFNRRLPVDYSACCSAGAASIECAENSAIKQQEATLKSIKNEEGSRPTTPVDGQPEVGEFPVEPEVALGDTDSEEARRKLERLTLAGASLDELDLSSARERLVAQVAKHPFWSTKAARRMQLTGSQRRGLFLYELVSHCEQRDLEWRYEPYRGGLSSPLVGRAATATSGFSFTSGSSSGAALDPSLVWALEVPACARPAPFAGSLYTCELPESSFVKRCHGCAGRGRLKCSLCHGVGYEVCISCSGRGSSRAHGSSLGGSLTTSGGAFRSTGSGDYSSSSWSSGRADESACGSSASSAAERRRADRNSSGGLTGSGAGGAGWLAAEACHYCHGAGQKRCWVCTGRAYNQCAGCLGTGQLRCYLSLNVTWSNHRDECIINNADNIIPRDRVRLASGLLLADRLSQPGESLEPLHMAALASARPLLPSSSHLSSCRRSDETATCFVDELTRQQIQAVSKKLLHRHALANKSKRLIRQRQKVTQIECLIVTYEWRQRSGHFVIYGNEKKVYIAKYPFKSICNIT